jgi:hypothetical protein
MYRTAVVGALMGDEITPAAGTGTSGKSLKNNRNGFFGESEKFRAPEHLFIVPQKLVRSLENERILLANPEEPGNFTPFTASLNRASLENLIQRCQPSRIERGSPTVSVRLLRQLIILFPSPVL